MGFPRGGFPSLWNSCTTNFALQMGLPSEIIHSKQILASPSEFPLYLSTVTNFVSPGFTVFRLPSVLFYILKKYI
jgi:hypothetical protein